MERPKTKTWTVLITRQSEVRIKIIGIFLKRAVFLSLVFFLCCCRFQPGGRSWGKQRHGLRTNPLMQGLRTRLECQHRVFVRTEKRLWKFTFGEKSIVALPYSNLLSSDLQRINLPLRHHLDLCFDGETVVLTTHRCSYYYYYYYYYYI